MNKTKRKFDSFSILGIAVAFVALLGGNFLEGGTWQSLLNLPAAVIVFGGTLGAAMLQTPFTTFRHSVKLLSWIVFPPQHDNAALIQEVSHWAARARKGGLLELEKIADKVKDPFSKKALDLLIDGTPPQDIRHILEVDMQLIMEKDLRAAKVFSNMGGYAPTIGILGAVMGLIYVMKNLADPSQLGPGIAIAFVATIYGVGIANLVLIPIANKLSALIETQLQLKEIVTEAVLYIADGENPKSIVMKLDGYESS